MDDVRVFALVRERTVQMVNTRIFDKILYTMAMTLNEVLQKLEDTTHSIFPINSYLRPLSNPNAPDSIELLSEKMAFAFQPDYKHDVTDWDTYYGPEQIWPLKDNPNVANIWPHYSLITKDVIAYWTKRAYECKNPIMAGRYADLVWDFQYKCTGTKPNHQIARRCIEEFVALADNKNFENEIDTYRCLERALNISLQIGDKDLVQTCKTAIINFEKSSTKDELPSTWGYAYDLLLRNKKITLSKEEEKEIIQDLEDILSRVTQHGNEDTWATENAAKKLTQYYSLKKDKSNIKRILYALEGSHRAKDNKDSAMQTSHWLNEMSDYYKKYDFSEDEDRILSELRQLGSGVDNEMKTIPFEFSITKEQMDDIVNPFIHGTINEVLRKFIWGWIPKVSNMKNEVLNAKNHFISLFNTVIYDSKGIAIGSLGSKEENIDRHIIRKTSEAMADESIFINVVLKRISELHGNISTLIMEFLNDCPIISPNRLPIIQQGVKAHFEGNYHVSLHLLIPQVEEAVRFLVESSGGNILQRNRFGGYDVKTFHEVLRHDITLKVLGEDIVNYFKSLFTHQLGWNLRNSIMHGLVEPDWFNFQKSERVIHALLCLKVVRKK